MPFIAPSIRLVEFTSFTYDYFYVRFNLLDVIAKGEVAKLTMNTNGQEYAQKGRISAVSGTVDSQTGAVTLRATFPNSGHLLHNGGIVCVAEGTVVVLDEDDESAELGVVVASLASLAESACLLCSVEAAQLLGLYRGLWYETAHGLQIAALGC